MKQTKKDDQADLSKYIEGWEPFLSESGELGFTLPYYKEDGIKTKSEWIDALRGSETDKDVPTVLEGRFRKLPRSMQNAVAQPDLEEDPSLLDDIIKFIREHVWIPDERYYAVLASWTIATWVHDFMETSPRLIFYATTRSGKTRAMSTLRELSYHGMTLDSPTPAVMYRLIEAHHPTLFLDEHQDLGDEMRQLVGSIFKSGFQQGGEVGRCDNESDRSSISWYSVYAPLAIAIKNRQPKEDELNRSVMVQMLTKPREAKIVRRPDKDAARTLRGRLLGLRYKVQTGMIDLEPLSKEASDLAMREIPGKDRSILLDDRAIEIAASLLLPSLIIGGGSKDSKVNAILGVVASSQAFSDDGLKDTGEGKAFSAIQAVYQCQDDLDQTGMDGKKLRNASKMSTKAVAEQFNLDIINEGNDNRDRVKTIVITGMIKSLGFRLKRGPHNQTLFDPDTFPSVYAVNLRKYGERGN